MICSVRHCGMYIAIAFGKRGQRRYSQEMLPAKRELEEALRCNRLSGEEYFSSGRLGKKMQDQCNKMNPIRFY